MTRLSNRQYPLLRLFARTDYMAVETAQRYDQRAFRSLLVRKWIVYRPGRGFQLTPTGRTAWEEFGHTSIERRDPRQPLTAYFDAAAFGLKTSRDYTVSAAAPSRQSAHR